MLKGIKFRASNQHHHKLFGPLEPNNPYNLFRGTWWCDDEKCKRSESHGGAKIWPISRWTCYACNIDICQDCMSETTPTTTGKVIYKHFKMMNFCWIFADDEKNEEIDDRNRPQNSEQKLETQMRNGILGIILFTMSDAFGIVFGSVFVSLSDKLKCQSDKRIKMTLQFVQHSQVTLEKVLVVVNGHLQNIILIMHWEFSSENGQKKNFITVN